MDPSDLVEKRFRKKVPKAVMINNRIDENEIYACPAFIYEDYPYFFVKENLCVDLIHKSAVRCMQVRSKKAKPDTPEI